MWFFSQAAYATLEWGRKVAFHKFLWIGILNCWKFVCMLYYSKCFIRLETTTCSSIKWGTLVCNHWWFVSFSRFKHWTDVCLAPVLWDNSSSQWFVEEDAQTWGRGAELPSLTPLWLLARALLSFNPWSIFRTPSSVHWRSWGWCWFRSFILSLCWRQTGIVCLGF